MRDNMPQPKPRYVDPVVYDYRWASLRWYNSHPFLAGVLGGVVGSATIATCVELVHLYGGF